MFLVDFQGYIPEDIEWEYSDGFEVYESTSFGADGTVTQLQAATVGNGIDLVFMGDAFSDRMIDNGDYDRVIGEAVEGFFSVEPYKSLRNYFNVYEVVAVSKNEYTAFETAFEVGVDGMYYYGNDDKVVQYAKKALGEDYCLDNVTIAVVANMRMGGGTAYFGGDSYIPKNDYGVGLGLCYFGYGSSFEQMKKALIHEMGGHAFAKLADEYFPTDDSISSGARTAAEAQTRDYGYWKNVDFTSSPSRVRWSNFIDDPRYASEQIGVYEGAYNYSNGAYRPTYNSVMNNIVPVSCQFNPPSREAIYYRINKLAFGEQWEYDYEEFVKFDLKL